MKKTINIILGLFVAASLVYLIVTELQTPQTEQKKTVEKKAEKSEDDRLNIYYFHATARCNSCMKIEKFTKTAVETGFEKELANKKIIFKLVNIDKSENKHFIDDFKLYTKSVIVEQIKNGKQKKWVNLEKVWDLLDNETQFSLYIQEEVKKNLDEAKL